MTQQNQAQNQGQALEWGDTSEGGDFFNKSALHLAGPQITTISGFAMKPYFENGETLHIAFNIPDNGGFGNCTKPMTKALQEMFPGMSPERCVGATVMVQAVKTEAKGNFSAGYQVIISPPPATNQVPPQAQQEVVF